MADSLEVQLENLRQAYFSGLLTCSYEGKSTTWRSAAEMRETIASLERQLAGGTTNPINVVVRPRGRYR